MFPPLNCEPTQCSDRTAGYLHIVYTVYIVISLWSIVIMCLVLQRGICRPQSSTAGYSLLYSLVKKFLRLCFASSILVGIMSRRIYSSHRGPDIWIVADVSIQKLVHASPQSQWRSLGYDFYWLDPKLYLLLLLKLS